MCKAKHLRLIIPGSGPAGYSAAAYAARNHLTPMPISALHATLQHRDRVRPHSPSQVAAAPAHRLVLVRAA